MKLLFHHRELRLEGILHVFQALVLGHFDGIGEARSLVCSPSRAGCFAGIATDFNGRTVGTLQSWALGRLVGDLRGLVRGLCAIAGGLDRALGREWYQQTATVRRFDVCGPLLDGHGGIFLVEVGGALEDVLFERLEVVVKSVKPGCGFKAIVFERDWCERHGAGFLPLGDDFLMK